MNEEQLNELSIFSLRELARRTGVGSPTSKTKNMLIKEILAISSGQKKPHIAKTRQGRPPKSYGYDFSNMFNTKSMPTQSATMTLNQTYTEFQTDEVVTLFGTIEIAENGSALLWVNKFQDYICFFVPAQTILKWNLKSGDRVMVSMEQNNEQPAIKEVLTINGCPALKFDKERKSYFNIPHVLSSKKLEVLDESFKNYNINLGENVYIYGSDNNQNTQTAINLLKSSKSQCKIYINVSIVEKNKHILKDLEGVELFVSKLTDDLDVSRRIVSLAIERSMRALEQGQDVLLVVDDALSVASVDSPELPILKKLVSISKCADDGSITIVAIMDNDRPISQIEKLSDKKIKI